MAVMFMKGATSITIQNPARGNVLSTRKVQAMARDAGGGRYVYDQGLDWRIMELEWIGLRESEKSDLESFFEDTADGMKEQFTYRDHQGTDWNAYFDQPSLEFIEIADEKASSGTFTSGGTTYPTTTREKGVYRVAVRLEVSAAS